MGCQDVACGSNRWVHLYLANGFGKGRIQGHRVPRSSLDHREVTPGFVICKSINIVTKYLACNQDEWRVGDLLVSGQEALLPTEAHQASSFVPANGCRSFLQEAEIAKEVALANAPPLRT
jgi:hypothetical protein